MCGIAGLFIAESTKDSEVKAGKLALALELLKQRGPNHLGIETVSSFRGRTPGSLSLGQTRLSIIDLSSAGHQPMHTNDGRYTIVFNGEIYNYRELRKELEDSGFRFITDSDTEVLLASWSVWGRCCLPRLIGMFAFAVCDRLEQTLTCVSDAFGIKPLFYSKADGNFLFASEIPALLALGAGSARLNWQRSYDYLVHGDYDSNEETFFDGIFHLLPGHLLKVDLTSGRVYPPERWWNPSITERHDLTFPQAVETVREAFLQSVKLHLRSDVPLGAALSGGIDSSAVVCAMRHVAPEAAINTFSYIAEGSELNEEPWVDLVNRHVGARAHKVVVSPQELARDLDDMIRTQGEPFGSTSIYAQYRVYQLAKMHGVTVTLDGQGADEMLAGYIGYPGQRLRSLLELGKWAEAWEFLNQWSRWPGRSRAAGLKRAVSEITNGSLHETLRKIDGRRALPPWINAKALEEHGVVRCYPRLRPQIDQAGRRVVAELALSLTTRGLPGLLRHGDRNSMRFSVESRVPFLTLEMVSLLLSLPESYLISPGGETKHVFRAAMRGIVPDDILDRRDKIGFATPERDWFFSSAGTVRQWLQENPEMPLLKQREVLASFDRILSGKERFSWQVWRWINFSRWHAQFLS
jgi:asparagine synthase (glutamine-hydrolysing)